MRKWDKKPIGNRMPTACWHGGGDPLLSVLRDFTERAQRAVGLPVGEPLDDKTQKIARAYLDGWAFPMPMRLVCPIGMMRWMRPPVSTSMRKPERRTIARRRYGRGTGRGQRRGLGVMLAHWRAIGRASAGND